MWEVKGHMTITLGDDTVLRVKGICDVPFTAPKGKKGTYIVNVLYVPGLKANLIFVARLEKQNMNVVFQKGKCTIRDSKNKIVAVGTRVDDLYKLNGKSQIQRAFSTVTHKQKI